MTGPAVPVGELPALREPESDLERRIAETAGQGVAQAVLGRPFQLDHQVADAGAGEPRPKHPSEQSERKHDQCSRLPPEEVVGGCRRLAADAGQSASFRRRRRLLGVRRESQDHNHGGGDHHGVHADRRP